jgi:hypothetical protein
VSSPVETKTTIVLQTKELIVTKKGKKLSYETLYVRTLIYEWPKTSLMFLPKTTAELTHNRIHTSSPDHHDSNPKNLNRFSIVIHLTEKETLILLPKTE